MLCPDIKGLEFDLSSKAAIDEIQELQGLANMLTVLIGSSVFVSLFMRSGGMKKPLGAAWEITQYDWGQWSQAMNSVPAILRHRVREIAFREWNRHLSGKEHDFWGGVMNGCGY
ncbi:MAG: hypothetical protein AABY83_15085 [Pseudomonadota bacterium]